MSVRRTCRVLVTTLLALAAALLMSQPAWAIDTTFRYEMNPQHNSGRCIGVQGGSTADGAHLVQLACAAGSSQRFTFQSVGGGAYLIHPGSAPGKCVAVEGRSTLNSAHIIQTTCANDLSQQFRILDDKLQAGLSGARIQAAGSGRCLDVPGFSNAESVKLVQFSCNGGANQRFDLIAST